MLLVYSDLCVVQVWPRTYTPWVQATLKNCLRVRCLTELGLTSRLGRGAGLSDLVQAASRPPASCRMVLNTRLLAAFKARRRFLLSEHVFLAPFHRLAAVRHSHSDSVPHVVFFLPSSPPPSPAHPNSLRPRRSSASIISARPLYRVPLRLLRHSPHTCFL